MCTLISMNVAAQARRSEEAPPLDRQGAARGQRRRHLTIR